MTDYLVVTGTDTSVGKTVATAALAVTLAVAGSRIAVVKPVQTGVGPDEPGDVDEVHRLAGVRCYEIHRMADALAPESAAHRTGESLPTISEHLRTIRSIDADLVIIEGAGGVLVQLDQLGGTIIDIARGLNADVAVVTREGLGTLNHTQLTVERLRLSGIEPSLVIGSMSSRPGLAAQCNRIDLPRLTGCAVIGALPSGARHLTVGEFRGSAPSWFDGTTHL